MVNPELNNSPELGISNVVYGRERRKDGRVIYFPDNKLLVGKKEIPEKIVLKRKKSTFLTNPCQFERNTNFIIGHNLFKIK